MEHISWLDLKLYRSNDPLEEGDEAVFAGNKGNLHAALFIGVNRVSSNFQVRVHA